MGKSLFKFIYHLIFIYYKNEDYRFDLNKGVFTDKAPKILKKLIKIWYNNNKDGLQEAWELMQTKKVVKLIEPLE
jgi:hypothetical protein